jgi:mRNA-degrading endonuclease RelE of RelBE toxin-antitoxin system
VTRRVRYARRAVDDLDSLPESDRRVIIAAVRAYAAGVASDVKKLQGMPGVYRLRCGRWRVIFELPAEEVLVLRVRDRKEAYR